VQQDLGGREIDDAAGFCACIVENGIVTATRRDATHFEVLRFIRKSPDHKVGGAQGELAVSRPLHQHVVQQSLIGAGKNPGRFQPDG